MYDVFITFGRGYKDKQRFIRLAGRGKDFVLSLSVKKNI